MGVEGVKSTILIPILFKIFSFLIPCCVLLYLVITQNLEKGFEVAVEGRKKYGSYSDLIQKL